MPPSPAVPSSASPAAAGAPLIWTNIILFSLTFLAAAVLVPWYGLTHHFAVAAWVLFGVFLIAYTVRAVRRGRPAGGADHPVDHGPAADQGLDRSAELAEPDTVMAERTEQGTAGAPGP